MAADIKLGNSNVLVEAFTLKVAGADIVLDLPARRKATGGLRRALVHNYDDGLTINWANDYPGGVTINGSLTATGSLTTNAKVTVGGPDIMLDTASRRKTTGGLRRALVHDFNDGLTINWAGDYPGGVTINGKVNCPGDLKVGAYDIEKTLASLLQRIAVLEARVATLENK